MIYTLFSLKLLKATNHKKTMCQTFWHGLIANETKTVSYDIENVHKYPWHALNESPWCDGGGGAWL